MCIRDRLLVDAVAELNFRRLAQVAHQRFESDLGIVLGDPLNHGLLLLFRQMCIRDRLNIAKRHLLPKQIERNALKKGELTVDDSAIIGIIRYYTREAVSYTHLDVYKRQLPELTEHCDFFEVTRCKFQLKPLRALGAV